MARRSQRDTPNRVRTYAEILADRDTVHAVKAIDRLTKKHGIAEIDLQVRVEAFRMYEHVGTGRRWSDRFTIDRESARRLADRLREDGAMLRNALTRKFKRVIGSPLSADTICDIISRSALLIEGSLAETDDRKPDWAHDAKRELTQFVWRTTGRPLDADVADLIGAILYLDGYTAEEQRKFRSRYCTLDGTDSIFDGSPKPDTIPQKND